MGVSAARASPRSASRRSPRSSDPADRPQQDHFPTYRRRAPARRRPPRRAPPHRPQEVTMSSQSHRRTLPLATALLALALTTPAVPAIAAGNTSAEPPPPNFPTAVPTRPGALTQPADAHASVAPAAANVHNRPSADASDVV